MNQHVLSLIIRDIGAAFRGCSNGVEALSALADGLPCDLVLTDLQMPVLDGYDLAAEITSRYPALPVIGISAHAAEDVDRRALDAGMMTVVTKPINAVHICYVISVACERPESESGRNVRSLSFESVTLIDEEELLLASIAERFGSADRQLKIVDSATRSLWSCATQVRRAMAATRPREVIQALRGARKTAALLGVDKRSALRDDRLAKDFDSDQTILAVSARARQELGVLLHRCFRIHEQICVSLRRKSE